MNKTIKLIEQLCEISGVSGREEPVSEFIQEQVKSYCDCHSDLRGNLICHKRGKKPPKNKLMLTAHMDEVGFLITYIEESGLLRFVSVGSIDTRVVVGKPVRLENGVCGVVGAKPVHLQSAADKENVLTMDKLYIDIGASSREEAEKDVSLGDSVVFHSQFTTLGESKIKGKALDNRAGCAVLIDLLSRDLAYDITAVFTTQQESGGNSAANAAFSERPDIAIIVDAAESADVSGVSKGDQVAVQGEGPCISFQDKGTLYDMDLYRRALKIGKKKDIPCQIKQGVVGNNESRDIQAAAGGTRVAAVSLPCRYTHSPSCVLDQQDVRSTIHLLEELVEQFGELA